jgi:6-phosphofructokinase 1
MVAYRHPNIIAVPFTEAIAKYNFVETDSALVQTARGVGISFGD